jgi:hypothetical protein
MRQSPRRADARRWQVGKESVIEDALITAVVRQVSVDFRCRLNFDTTTMKKNASAGSRGRAMQ